MQQLTERLLDLWQEQVSLLTQDPETLGYGDVLFKAMGITPPISPPFDHASPASEKATDDDSATNEDATTKAKNSAGAEATDGAETASLSSEQRAAMVDELSRRINELAGQIAEHEANTVPSKPEG